MERALDFLKGMSMIFDIKPRRGAYTVNKRSDSENLASDWKKVGGDMDRAVGKYNAKRKRNQRRAA